MILYKTKYLTLKSAKREGASDWVYAHRDNAKNVVAILPLIINDIENEVIFLITKRPPLIAENIAEFCVETPAGLVGDEIQNETIEDALKKELLEETGLVADSFEILCNKAASSAGLTSETITIALAKIKDKTIIKTPQTDGGVIVQRVYIPISKIKSFLIECSKKGYAISVQALAALFYIS